MQFNSEANNQDLISDITFWLGVDINKFTLKDRTRSINEWLNTVWTWIFESYGGWRFMDDNQSDTSTGIPYATQTVTSGTALYALPTGSLTVNGVQLLTTSGGAFNPLTPMTEEEFLERGGDGSFPTTGVPAFYMLQGDIIRLLPTPNFTLASALRVHFDKAMTAFTTTDTTAVPGFASVFHRVLSIGASWDYARARGIKDKIVTLQPVVVDYEARIKAFYAKRFKDRFPNNIPPAEDLVDQYS